MHGIYAATLIKKIHSKCKKNGVQRTPFCKSSKDEAFLQSNWQPVVYTKTYKLCAKINRISYSG